LTERVIVGLIDTLHYCRQRGLITKQQHGFLAKMSTVINMLSCINNWTGTLMNNFPEAGRAVAYIDFHIFLILCVMRSCFVYVTVHCFHSKSSKVAGKLSALTMATHPCRRSLVGTE